MAQDAPSGTTALPSPAAHGPAENGGSPIGGIPGWVRAAFVLFPFLLAMAGQAILTGGEGDQARLAAEHHLDTLLSQVEAARDPHEHFTRFFRRLEDRTFAASEPQELWDHILTALKERYPDQVQGVFLDGGGNPVPGLTDRPTARTLARTFYQAYRRFRDEHTELPSLALSFIRSYFGQFVPQGFAIHGQLLFAAGPPRTTFIYLSDAHPQGMFFLFFSPRTYLRTLALEEEIAAVRPRAEGARLGLALTGESGSRLWRRLGLPGSRFAAHWRQLNHAAPCRLWEGPTLVARRLVFPGVWVVGRLDVPPRALHPGEVRPFLVALALVALALFPLGPLASLLSWLAGSVRLELLAAFLYSAGVPLLVMGLTAHSYLADRREVLVAASHRAMEATLMGFDGRFRLHLTRLEDDLRRLYYARPSAPPDGFADFRNRFADWHAAFGFDSCYIFDRHGATAFQFQDPTAGAVSPNTRQALGRVARQYALQQDREVREAEGTASSPVAARSIDEFSETPMPIDLLFFNEMKSGHLRFYLYCFPLGTADNRVTHYGFLVWDTDRMERNYLQAELGRLSRRAGGGEFFAWSPLRRGEEFPPDFRHRRLVAPAMAKVSSRSRSHRTVLSGRQGTYLLTGLRCTSLSRFSLLGLVADQPILAEIAGLRWNIAFIALVIAGVSVIIGVLLAGFFLVPIRRLTEGMAAIAGRRFDTRIPVTSADELGGLATLFNDALADLQDLELARTVQEHLFPKTSLTAGGWEAAGACWPASQVGGDFFDFHPGPDGRLRLVIGDVSGHGVGAALVVALVKAALGHPATPADPAGALTCLNGLLGSILQRKKMMSCALASFDPAAGSLALANAGQTYPVLVTPDGATFLEARGYPLGSSRRWKAADLRIDLPAGAAVVFYTDGLVEATAVDGSPVGYGRFLETLPGLIGTDAAATVAALRAWHLALAPRQPPADDITLLVLQKRRSPPPLAAAPTGAPA
ncbi:MAG: SpoIIE family protein phosphatase [Candidatus Riflebacteria bacterium]|nr:SpoIIE family protein phosphatase [Candidatus Riflebacteria bacterium]